MSANDPGLVGRTLMGLDGHKIGRIKSIYVNSSTGEPEWVAIDLGGLLADKLGFAPVARVTSEGDVAIVDFDKKHLKHAPTTRSEGVLSPSENEALYHYYGIDHGAQAPAGSHDRALRVGH
jgi:PRC-barrel domain